MGAVTVRELLTLPSLRGSYVVAGNGGIERKVSGVNVMEVPDIESFVKPGELLLTTTYPLREHPESLGALVRTLAGLGLAAIAVKTGRYLDRLPDDMLAAADELGFPVIVVEEQTSFNEVIGSLLAVVLTEYGAEAAGAEAIRERLTGVALSGGGLEEIARTLAGALDRTVQIVDLTGVPLGAGGPALAADADLWSFPVSVANAVRGRILVSGQSEPTLGQRRLIRQACFAAAMHIAQALAGLSLDRQMRVLFLEELVSGNPLDEPLVRQRSTLFGWDLGAPHVVLLARCTRELADSAIGAGARDQLPAGALAWSRGFDVVALAPAGPHRDNSWGSIASAWREELVRAGGGEVTVAVGSLAASTDELPRSHQMATEAIGIARATGRQVVQNSALGLERVMLAVPRDRLEEMVQQELGALIEADRSGDSDLCRTLETYLGTANGADAARRLYIHYNTLKHRMQRIRELLPGDLNEPRARLTVAFALQARKFI